jgi:uncharacterized protein (TIGR02147 family)
LTRIKTFKGDVKYVADILNISQTEAHIAIERLQRLGFLKILKNGRWVDATANGLATNINGDFTSEASKKLQKQVLLISLEALEELPTQVRNHTSMTMTMTINAEDIPEAKDMIKKFRRELCAFFERNKKPNHVYQLGVSLYPLTKLEKNNEI